MPLRVPAERAADCSVFEVCNRIGTYNSHPIFIGMNLKIRESKAAYLYLAFTILLWSSVPALAKLALKELDNFQLLFYVSIIGTASLFILNAFSGKIPVLLKYTKIDFLRMFGMGFFDSLFGKKQVLGPHLYSLECSFHPMRLSARRVHRCQ